MGELGFGGARGEKIEGGIQIFPYRQGGEPSPLDTMFDLSLIFEHFSCQLRDTETTSVAMKYHVQYIASNLRNGQSILSGVGKNKRLCQQIYT